MTHKVKESAEAVKARLLGDGDVQVSGVASIASASSNDLVFVEDEKHLSQALKSRAGAVIAGKFALAAEGKPLLICSHPKLVFARAACFLRDEDGHRSGAGVHASAVIHSSVRLGTCVMVEELAVIAED